jgi:hypothetical protein
MRAAVSGLAWALWATASATEVAAQTKSTVEDGVAAALAAALPPDGRNDLCVIDRPPLPRAPRVRCATIVAAPPDALKAVLLDPGHYAALIPALVRSDAQPARGDSTAVAWELEVPLFNLSGTLALRDRGSGVELDLYDGDFAPGRIDFHIKPRPGGATLIVDAQLDIRHSSWLVRRIVSRSPAGEPAALAAATYVALRGTALRAEHPSMARAYRPSGSMAPPATWPDVAPLGSLTLSPLSALGIVALVTRAPDSRLAGVTAAAAVRARPSVVETTLRDPQTWRVFPGWNMVRLIAGPLGPGAEVTDDLPLVDLDAIWTAERASPPRWVATSGAIRGARLGWALFPLEGGHATFAALELYPRLETSGWVARRFIAAEPLLESGLALGLAVADVAGVADALQPPAR